MQPAAMNLANNPDEPPLRKKIKYSNSSRKENSLPKSGISLKIANEKIQIKPPENPASKNQASSTSVMKILLSDPSKYNDSFTGIKYKNTIYRVKDNLLIRNDGDTDNDFICKLVRVIRPIDPEEYKLLAALEVQWYYKRTELPKKFASSLCHIGENEVFLSTHMDFITADCINDFCSVLSYDEYDKLTDVPPNTFYSRAGYNVKTKTLSPPIDEWPKHCICKTPLNPDCNYVQCDKCATWFHIECLKITAEEANDMEQYECVYCKKVPV